MKVKQRVARALGNLSRDDLSACIDGDDHDQRAIQFLTLRLWEIQSSLRLNLASNHVVVTSVRGFLSAGADIAFTGTCILFLYAFFDLRQQVDELLALPLNRRIFVGVV